MITTSEQIDQIAPALFAARQEMHKVAKSQEMTQGGRYAYADFLDYLTAVMPPMATHGLVGVYSLLSVEASPFDTDAKEYRTQVVVAYRVIHAESGQWFEVRGGGEGYDTLDKATGKAQTYAKKYATGLMWGLPSADDTDHRSSPTEMALADELLREMPAIESPGDADRMLKRFDAFSGEVLLRLRQALTARTMEVGIVFDKTTRAHVVPD